MEKEPLKIGVSSGGRPGTRVISLKGPLVLGNFFEFQQELRKEDAPLTVIDLTEVPYMDSTGMGGIINFYVHCQRVGSRMAVVAPNERVIEIFRLTHVDTLLRIVPTLDAALQ